MQTLQLGQTGEMVSSICLGALPFGSLVNEKLGNVLMDQYFDAGGRFFDTANIYVTWTEPWVGGESETALGNWIAARGNRNDVFIATKMGFGYQDVPRSTRAEHIVQECEKSLKRLRINTIDLYYTHADDRTTPLEESLAAFDQLIREGKIRHIGASNFAAWRLARALDVSQTNNLARYCCIQQRHSFLRPRPGTDFLPQVSSNSDLIDICRSDGLSVLAFSPLLNGAFSRPDREFPEQYIGGDSTARLLELQQVAAEVDATVNQVILAWMLASTPAVIPLLGVSNVDQLTENLGALEVIFTKDQMQRLNNAAG